MSDRSQFRRDEYFARHRTRANDQQLCSNCTVARATFIVGAAPGGGATGRRFVLGCEWPFEPEAAE